MFTPEYMHTYIHAYIHTYIRTYLRTNIHMYIFAVSSHWQMSIGENLSVQLPSLLYMSVPGLPILDIVLAITIPFLCILLCCVGCILLVTWLFRRAGKKKLIDVTVQMELLEQQIKLKAFKMGE